ncbi:FadR/GntR family transcriptional regulator [Streptomyces sp. NPDC059247]|uniref:FadR/GntR family transcriptional regulator n=1 Tax=Streptomyces sp. NPDC059247 TaxID=3346790 RepID=UPI0036A7152E
MAHDTSDSGGGRRVARGRIADHIVEDLRERILSGELPDGSRLPAERELADEYGVSGATVREAVRVLSATGLLRVRHGSGTFVTAEPDTMIGMSVASVVRLEGAGVPDVLGILGALTRYAAQLAARHASDEEIAALREAAEELAMIDDVARTQENLRTYLRRLIAMSHNALLIPLCRLLVDVQIELAAEMSGGQLSEWRRVAGALHEDRIAIVEALESRSPEQAAQAADAYGHHAHQLAFTTLQAKEAEALDPRYARLLAGIFTTRLGPTGY